MTDHHSIIERLEQQNALADTTEAQREANSFRIQWLNRLHKEKHPYTPTAATDMLLEAHKQPGYTCSPGSLL